MIHGEFRAITALGVTFSSGNRIELGHRGGADRERARRSDEAGNFMVERLRRLLRSNFPSLQEARWRALCSGLLPYLRAGAGARWGWRLCD